MKTLILTGATGFTGRFLVKEALKRKYKIIALVRASSNTNFLTENGISVLVVDFSDKDALIKTLKELKSQIGKPSLIIHNAGITKTLRKFEYELSNTVFTRNFVEALEAIRLIPDKFIYTSRLAAIGPGNSRTLKPIAEEDDYHPVTYYGKSKKATELYLKSKTDFPWIIVRPTAVYGPGDGDTLKLFKGIKAGLEVSITSSTQHLSFIYVEDMAKAYYEVADKSPVNEIYNLSDGFFYTQKQLNDYIKKELNKKTVKLIIRPFVLRAIALFSELGIRISGKTSILTRDKVNELQETNWKTDSTKIFNLGFKSETDLESGIYKTLKWYMEHGWI